MLDQDALASLKGLKSKMEADKERADATIKGTQSSYGFAVLDDGREIFVTPDEMLKVLQEDRVKVCVHPGREGKLIADIERLIESPLGEFAGVCVTKGKAFFVQPDYGVLTRWLFVPPHARNGAKAGDYVRCAILRHPIKDGKPQAKILSVLGNTKTPGLENQYALTRASIPQQWPAAILKQIESLVALPYDESSRVDLTGLGFVSIDAAKTQDIDDALYAETSPDGWTLYVAIADPSDAIVAGSELNQAVAQRATTVYLHGDVVPMLPEALAKGRYALAEGVTRPALVLKAEISNSGTIKSFEFIEALIQSHGKLSYYAVERYLEGHNEDPVIHASAVEALYQLFRVLRQHRSEHELVMEDRQEFRWILDDSKQIESIEPSEKLLSQKLVEECMVVANRCAAEFMMQHQCPGPFITHEGFRDDRQAEAEEFFQRFAPELVGTDLTTLKGFRAVIATLAGSVHELPLRAMINRLLTRASLTIEPGAHMGMAIRAYTNFTSPLRKYADLLVHRQIKAVLRGQPSPTQGQPELDAISDRLIRVRDVSQYAERWLAANYLHKLTGFKREALLTGVVAHISSSGFNVRLDDNGLEGFIDLRKDPEKFTFDKWTASLTSTTRRFTLAQPVTIWCSGFDPKTRVIHFELAEGCGHKDKA